MLTTITTAVWFQKTKLAADAIWGVASLFCVPCLMFASACLFIPVRSTGKPVWDVHAMVQSARTAPGTNTTDQKSETEESYRLGLFDAQGNLIHEYPAQIKTSGRDAGQGSIVVDVPDDIPSGSYSLRVFKAEAKVRDVPIKVGERNAVE